MKRKIPLIDALPALGHTRVAGGKTIATAMPLACNYSPRLGLIVFHSFDKTFHTSMSRLLARGLLRLATSEPFINLDFCRD
jgi:hypothetical protein